MDENNQAICIKALDLVFTKDEIPTEDEMEGMCPVKEHRRHRRLMTIKEFYERTSNSLDKSLSEVESICIFKLCIGSSYMRRMRLFCPKLNCLSIISPQFTRFAFKELIELLPRLSHFMSGGFIKIKEMNETDEFLMQFLVCEEFKGLEDWKLHIKTNDDFNPYWMRKLQPNFTYLYLIDEKHILCNIINHLYNGEGKDIQFLRFESFDGSAYKAFPLISKLPNLRGLNISVKTSNDLNDDYDISKYVQYYRHISNCNKLETLTLDLNIDTKGIIKMISMNPKFKDTLQRIRLQNGSFVCSDFALIVNNFKNLESLQLIKCEFFFKNLKRITKMIANMKHLNELIVENDESENEIQYLCLGYENIKQIMNSCPKLQYVSLESSFNEKDIYSLKEVAVRRNIDFEIVSFDSESMAINVLAEENLLTCDQKLASLKFDLTHQSFV